MVCTINGLWDSERGLQSLLLWDTDVECIPLGSSVLPQTMFALYLMMVSQYHEQCKISACWAYRILFSELHHLDDTGMANVGCSLGLSEDMGPCREGGISR